MITAKVNNIKIPVTSIIQHKFTNNNSVSGTILKPREKRIKSKQLKK
jgi:hypothetical protein